MKRIARYVAADGPVLSAAGGAQFLIDPRDERSRGGAARPCVDRMRSSPRSAEPLRTTCRGADARDRPIPAGRRATAVAARLLARQRRSDVRDVLARVPAPRIVLLQGSVAFVTMEPFARFLVGMGYPEERLRNPRDGSYSYSSFADSAALAGELAFDYEQTGLEPMLIGHSQGGMLAIRVLHEFAGAFHDAIPVVDPATGVRRLRARRSSIRARDDRGPSSGCMSPMPRRWRPDGCRACCSASGRCCRGCAQIPDTVTEFTGFDIPNDPIAGNLLGISPYEAVRAARTCATWCCPPEYSHIATAAGRRTCSADPVVRAMDRRLATRRGTAVADGRHDATSSMPPTSGTASSATGACRRRRLLRVPAS